MQVNFTILKRELVGTYPCDVDGLICNTVVENLTFDIIIEKRPIGNGRPLNLWS